MTSAVPSGMAVTQDFIPSEILCRRAANAVFRGDAFACGEEGSERWERRSGLSEMEPEGLRLRITCSHIESPTASRGAEEDSHMPLPSSLASRPPSPRRRGNSPVSSSLFFLDFEPLPRDHLIDDIVGGRASLH